MKYRETTVAAFLIIFLISSGVESFCQKTEPAKTKLKSATVYTEKTNALVAKRFKESEITYDQQGNMLEEIYYKEGRVTKHFKYQYDADGNKVREEEFDPSGKLKEFSEYKFNKGLRTEKIVYDPQRNIKMKKTYVYTTY